MTTNDRALVAIFDNQEHARMAVRDLRQAGFTEGQIGIVTRDGGVQVETAGNKGSHAAEGAAIGVAAGAGVGALWALGIAANILPGIGPVVSGGIIASILASAAGGAAVAGIAGALIGLGVPEEDARYYEGEVTSGRTLVTVKAGDRTGEAWMILHRHGATRRDTAATAGHARSEASGTMKLHEERLHAEKSAVQTGEVQVRKEVTTERQTLEVPVTREEVVIERRPASGAASASDLRPGEEIRIPVREERVHVEKTPVVIEEVHVGKRTVTETEEVAGTVRKEHVKVEKRGDVEVRGDVNKTGPR